MGQPPRMFGLSWGLNGLEHHLARELWRDLTKGLDVYLIYTDIEDLEKIDREAQEEIEKRLNCKD